ncbi:MAG TPA: sigma-70 family RNA polymerase sigma factor [Solirubrobacteraceae bacterium]|nr:sigma-70 family RNA polymerase sigma factor [Solirubrobacteraceae bacterium]
MLDLAAPTLDAESAGWLEALGADGHEAEAACARLHDLLLRVARGEVRRRGPAVGIDGPELDDLAHQAAADALVAIRRKLFEFRGESRFTTWAYRFVIFEVSTKLGRHFWRRPHTALDNEDWSRLPDRFGFGPERESEWRDLMTALRDAVDHALTPRQRQVFVAVVLNGITGDTLMHELGTTRNAIYKTLYDARRKLRAELVSSGHLDAHATA